jgi:hypothetical protein
MSKKVSANFKRKLSLLLLAVLCLGVLLTLGSGYCYAQEELPTIKLPDIQ